MGGGVLLHRFLDHVQIVKVLSLEILISNTQILQVKGLRMAVLGSLLCPLIGGRVAPAVVQKVCGHVDKLLQLLPGLGIHAAGLILAEQARV